MITTCSQNSEMSARSWLIKSTARPNSAWSCSRRSIIWACTVVSSAVVGSSAISRDGRPASAMATATRCCKPPESSYGYCLARSAGVGDPRDVEHLERSLPCHVAGSVLVHLDHFSHLVADPLRGVQARRGVLKHKPISRPRIARNRVGEAPSNSSPRKRMEPDSSAPRGARPAMLRAVIVLPDPLSPASPSTSPSATTNDRPSTTRARF